MSEKSGLQSILTGALLVLVGMAFGAILVKAGQSPTASESAMRNAAPAQQVVDTATQPGEDAVLVYLCHGNTRCPTCRKIESSTKDVLERIFGDEIRSGRLIIKEVNYEQPENKDLISKYEIIAPTVIMVCVKDGKESEYRNLMEVWQTVHEPATFEELISSNLKALLPDKTS